MRAPLGAVTPLRGFAILMHDPWVPLRSTHGYYCFGATRLRSGWLVTCSSAMRRRLDARGGERMIRILFFQREQGKFTP